MATETYTWSNQSRPPQGVSTSRTLVAPPVLPVPNQHPPQQRISSWPNQSVPQQRPVATPTLVAPDPQALGLTPTLVAAAPPALAAPNRPVAQTAFGYAPNQPASQQGQGTWPNQPAQPGLGDWPKLSAPQPWSSTPATGDPLGKRKRKGRGLVACSLWAFAGGLYAAPYAAEYADQGLEAGIAWLATWAPSFVRPYLPKPVESVTPASRGSRIERPAPAVPSPPERAVPAEAPRQAKPVVTTQAKASVADAPEPIATERPAKQTRLRSRAGAHDNVAVELATAEASAPVVTATPKRGKPDPFDSAGGGEREPVAPARAAKPAAEPAPAKAQPSTGLDDLMAGVTSPSKPHDKRSASREIDAMLKDVQKSDPPPPPKRVEPPAPPSLTAADIAKVMASVKSGANACGKRFGQNGLADLKLTVGRDGKVSDVAVRGKLADSAVGRCVAQTVRSAVFPRSAGLTFEYRIDVH